jgi:dihydropteroate synthase
MGVVNVTPDSFSDGGRYLDPEAAIAHGLRLIAEGADVVDVGGESTRPGATPVDARVELDRVVPVVAALAGRVRLSVDTTKAEVAEAAVAAGATLINDVSATLWPVAAAAGVGWVAMHMQGTPAVMQQAPRYDDVVGEVRRFLGARAALALEAGVPEVWVDPGIGFGKSLEHNLALLCSLRSLAADGVPVLVGTSRKSFLTAVLGAAPPDDRLEGSIASAVWAMSQGVGMVRVHDVAATVQAARLLTEDVTNRPSALAAAGPAPR